MDDKRQHRQLKREIKRAGNRKRRRHLQRQMRDQPEDAPRGDFDFGRNSSAALNGIDRDATRRGRREGEDG
jgi:hypothetical protein